MLIVNFKTKENTRQMFRQKSKVVLPPIDSMTEEELRLFLHINDGSELPTISIINYLNNRYYSSQGTTIVHQRDFPPDISLIPGRTNDISIFFRYTVRIR